MGKKRTRKGEKEQRARERRVDKKPGREFEEAVYNFVKTLADKDSEVIFDHKQLSVFTGKPRQVDAWIRTKVLRHYPLSIAVSCKDYGRPLDDTHIEDFHARIESYGASTGIIYSRKGFRPGAVELAKKFGIACCQLWKNRPADIPGLMLIRYYWCCPAIVVPLRVTPADSGFSLKTWDELFEYRVTLDGETKTVVEHIVDLFKWGAEQAANDHKGHPESAFPEPWEAAINLEDCDIRPTMITIQGTWRKYRGQLKATLLNGSYCETTREFRGTETGPPLVVEGLPSSPEWEEITENPKTAGVRSLLMMAMRTGGLADGLRETLHGQSLPSF